MPLNGQRPAVDRMDRAWIEAHIPHKGRMCLLDEILSWDSRHVRCRSTSHTRLDHPLRRNGQLGIACGIEYVAQAMAMHGAIDAERSSAGAAKAEVGFLAGVREVRMHVSRLDDIDAELICEVRRIAGDAVTAIYTFNVQAADRPLLTGRASVVLDVRPRLAT